MRIDGAGPPVVLSHDALTHSEAWDAQVAAWSGRPRRPLARDPEAHDG
jgi:hypothetical protein